jgi:hypothetical protein
MLKIDALKLTCGQRVLIGHHRAGRRGWQYDGSGRVMTVNHNGGVLIERGSYRSWHPYSDVHPDEKGERPERLIGTEDDFT